MVVVVVVVVVVAAVVVVVIVVVVAVVVVVVVVVVVLVVFRSSIGSSSSSSSSSCSSGSSSSSSSSITPTCCQFLYHDLSFRHLVKMIFENGNLKLKSSDIILYQISITEPVVIPRASSADLISATSLATASSNIASSSNRLAFSASVQRTEVDAIIVSAKSNIWELAGEFLTREISSMAIVLTSVQLAAGSDLFILLLAAISFTTA